MRAQGSAPCGQHRRCAGQRRPGCDSVVPAPSRGGLSAWALASGRHRLVNQPRKAAPVPVASPSSGDLRRHSAAVDALTATPHSHSHAGAPMDGHAPDAAALQAAASNPATGQASSIDHDEQLYEELRCCEHWQDVADIVSDEGADMATRRVVQALTRATALLKPLPHAERDTAVNSTAFASLLALLNGRVPSMKPSQVSATLSCLAALRARLAPDALAQLSSAAGAHAASLSARDLAGVLHAFVALGAKPTMSTLDRLGYRAHLILVAQREQQQQQQQQSGDGDGDSSECAAGVSGTGAAGAREGGAGRRDAFAPQGVSMLVHAAAKLGYSNTRLLASAADVAAADIARFSPQAVANVLWGMATLDHYFADLVTACLERLSRASGALRPQEAANVMWALQKLRHHPQEHAKALLAPLTARGAALVPADVAMALSMLATFGMAPGEQVLSQLARALEGMVERCSARELSASLWALALMGESGRAAFAAAAAALPARFDAGEMSDAQLRQAFQALLCAKLREAADAGDEGAAAAGTASSPAFPDVMLDAMKRAWVAGIQSGVARARGTSSPTRALSVLCSGLRVRHDAARTTRDGLVLIDIALRPSDERFVALQVLRDFDVSRNTGQLLAGAQFERQVLEKNGWEVRFLRHADLMMVDEAARAFFVAEFLRGVGCRVVKHVAAPGEHAAPGGGSMDFARASVPSHQAREADIVLSDPKARAQRRRQ